MNGTTQEVGKDAGITLSFNAMVRSNLLEALKSKGHIAEERMKDFLVSPSLEKAEQLRNSFQDLGDFSYRLSLQVGLIYEATKILQEPTVQAK